MKKLRGWGGETAREGGEGGIAEDREVRMRKEWCSGIMETVEGRRAWE